MADRWHTLLRVNVPVSSKVRVIVDEGLDASSPLLKRFQQTLAPDRPVEWSFLAQERRGIPDTVILGRLLGPDAVLLTRDRVLHNWACDLGFRSYTLDEQGNLRRRKLPAVRLPKSLPELSGDLKEDYAHPPNPLASALKTTLAERDFKRYRTRRRRIRSYFGSEAQISSVAVTIGVRRAKKGYICGFFLAVAGNSGVKGIRASEGYALAGQGALDPAWCVLHALKDVFLLQLEAIPAELFVIPPDSLRLCQQLLDQKGSLAGSPPAEAARLLLNGLKQVRISPCVKGRFFEAMDQKLNQLAGRQSNELVPAQFEQMVAALGAGTAHAPKQQ